MQATGLERRLDAHCRWATGRAQAGRTTVASSSSSRLRHSKSTRRRPPLPQAASLEWLGCLDTAAWHTSSNQISKSWSQAASPRSKPVTASMPEVCPTSMAEWALSFKWLEIKSFTDRLGQTGQFPRHLPRRGMIEIRAADVRGSSTEFDQLLSEISDMVLAPQSSCPVLHSRPTM